MIDSIVEEATATGDQIWSITEKLVPALSGVQRGHAIIALLSIVLATMNPDLSPDQIRDGVLETSRFMCLWVDGASKLGESTPSNKVN